jgi:fatty acid-binding protein DegV
VDAVKAIAPEAEVHITRAGCTISSHCGRNTLGVLFIRTSPIVRD